MSSEKRWRILENAVIFYLETDPNHLLRQTAKPTYVSCKIFHENLVAVNMKKERLKLDKPSYIGMGILDLCKVLVYDFHYNYIKEKDGGDSHAQNCYSLILTHCVSTSGQMMLMEISTETKVYLTIVIMLNPLNSFSMKIKWKLVN